MIFRMEFTELIKTPKIENVVCIRSVCPKKETGTLCLTSHHIIFVDRCKSAIEEELILLYTSIEHVEKKFSGIAGVLILYCKDFTALKLNIPGQEEAVNVAASIESLSSLESAVSYHPFFFIHMKFDVEIDGWNMFPLQEEYNKVIGASTDWRISTVNNDFKICSSYPTHVVVPTSITDEILKMSASFRSSGRFPVLSYLHKHKVPIMRCSQPLVGQSNKRCKEDEKLLSAISHGFQAKGVIVDTRSLGVIGSHKHKGGGCETDFYTQWRRVPQCIEKASHLGETVFRLNEACLDPRSNSWLAKLEASGWMRYIESCLQTARNIVVYVDKEESPVIVHGESGMDITLVVTSLAQVLLNPDCRTIVGFESLIVREWLWGGYPFTLRHMKLGTSPARKKGNAAVFLLFLDCMHQLMNQYASSFEMSEEFLLTLGEHSYYSSYGTFLFNTELERKQNDVRGKTQSLWSYLNDPNVTNRLKNTLYDRNDTVLIPSVFPQSLTLWNAMFLKSMPMPDARAFQDVHDVIIQTKTENKELKLKANQLKQKYEQLLQTRGQV